jgi:hypothetical protein
VADAGRAEGDRAGETGVERRQRVDAGEEEEAHREHDRPQDLDRARAVTVDGAAHEQRVASGRELEEREAVRHRAPAAEVVREGRQENAPCVEDEPRVHGVADERHEHDPPAVEQARAARRRHSCATNTR